MKSTAKAPPKEGAKGFLLNVLPSRECLNKALLMNGCCMPKKCWHYVAINALMDMLEPGVKHNVRVDGGHVKLNYRGWRYVADTPSHVKRSLMLFDRKKYDDLYIRKYSLRFRRTTKVLEKSEERKAQIRAAREQRIAEGRDYYPRPTVDLRKRIEGFSSLV